jgi:ferrochelatase
MDTKIKVILGQLGSPKSPKVGDVRSFLKEFLGDPRVVDMNPFWWKIILYLFILPFRPKKSAQAYQRIWQGDGFPLVKITKSLSEKMKSYLHPRLELNHAFLVCEPRVEDLFKEWDKEDPLTRAQEVVVVPLFPQYAESTIGSVVDIVGQSLNKRVNIPSFKVVNSFHRSKLFIDHSVRLIQEHLKKHPVDRFIISFHGIPTRRVTQKKDIYFQHCIETFELLKPKIQTFFSGEIAMTFQSRFGSEVWLGPATNEVAVDWAKKGVKKIGFYCPSFLVDCLETTDEIGHELQKEIAPFNSDLALVPCLNDEENWVKAFSEFINVYTLGSQEQRDALFYPIDVREKLVMATHEQAAKMATPLSPESKKALKTVFLTMFIDLMGFSIIFPLFPAMAKYYLQWDQDNIFLSTIFSWVSSLQSMTGGMEDRLSPKSIVLFGGILGALYSLLQFIAAPIWGAISDRVGRKPVLVISLVGLLVSYFIWFFSGNFTLLILSRAIGGIMSGNLSIASAIVADVTDDKNRSKGMAVIGIAFALGFVLGPAMGGILSQVNLVRWNPALGVIGVNQFSTPALAAFILTLINIFMVLFIFKETLPKEKRGQHSTALRTINPIKLFKPLPYKGANITNLAYFFFIAAFSGMEFTLTFLAVERLQFTSMDNGMMFVFIGVFIGLVQGGYVRRKAGQIGEAKMAKQGLVTLVPGLAILAFAQSKFLLYFGLFFLATGSAMVIPCMTSLVSLFTPSTEQGKALGIFRSLGALGRLIGPLLGSLLYWRLGSQGSYLVGAFLILIPLLIMRSLTEPSLKQPAAA